MLNRSRAEATNPSQFTLRHHGRFPMGSLSALLLGVASLSSSTGISEVIQHASLGRHRLAGLGIVSHTLPLEITLSSHGIKGNVANHDKQFKRRTGQKMTIAFHDNLKVSNFICFVCSGMKQKISQSY